jgi:hypothetical protein
LAPIAEVTLLFRREKHKLPVSEVVFPRAMKRAPGFSIDAEVLIGIALLSAVLVLGLSTAADYGLTVDEFNTDDYGPKALAWYTSGFKDRSHFETVEFSLWYYGPWFHMLTAYLQSFDFADRITVRHAATFVAGLAGMAALLPIGRIAIGRWAGLTAIVLCLMTGYFYGSLFFTPIDVPFLAAMTWATLAIVVMTRGSLPSWPATAAVGLLTGLAIATRTGGIITHAYLFGAMVLCVAELWARHGRLTQRYLCQIAVRYAAVVTIAWAVTIALWPWLQIGNPWAQFKSLCCTLRRDVQIHNVSRRWSNRARTRCACLKVPLASRGSGLRHKRAHARNRDGSKREGPCSDHYAKGCGLLA